MSGVRRLCSGRAQLTSAPDQRRAPKRVGRGSRNPPTGYGGRGLGVGSALVSHSAIAAGRVPARRLLGRKLKAARGGQPEPRDLGDDARESFVPKPLFGGGQNLPRERLQELREPAKRMATN